MITTNELRQLLDKHISASNQPNGFIIVHPAYYHAAKYSCTTDHTDFTLFKGNVYYRGFKIVKSKF